MLSEEATDGAQSLEELLFSADDANRSDTPFRSRKPARACLCAASAVPGCQVSAWCRDAVLAGLGVCLVVVLGGMGVRALCERDFARYAPTSLLARASALHLVGVSTYWLTCNHLPFCRHLQHGAPVLK